MENSWGWTAATLTLLLLGGCDMPGAEESFVYKMTPDGAPELSDLRAYESLGDQTFTKTQKYRLSVQGSGKKPFHYFIGKLTKKVGGKVVDSTDGRMFPITDGLYILECAHYYSQKLSKSVDDAGDPVCEVEPTGVLVPNGRATMVPTIK